MAGCINWGWELQTWSDIVVSNGSDGELNGSWC